MRVFAALIPPDHVTEDLDDFLSPRRDDQAASLLGWSRPQSWHLTLAFMGAARPDAVEAFVERLAQGAVNVAVPQLQVRGGGAFPVVERARVLYAGVPDPSGSLERLSERVRSTAAVTGCAPDGRAFLPHLTLARTRRPIEATRWVRVLDTYVGPPWQPEEVAVVESHVGQGRPRHSVLERVPLGRGSMG